MSKIRRLTAALALTGLLAATPAFLSAQDEQGAQGQQARKTIDEAIQAMGGEAYLNMTTLHNYGNWFSFNRHGQRSRLVRYWEYIHYDPIKYYFQLGKGGRQNVLVYNMELGKGWSKQGKGHVEELEEERVERFRKSAKHDLDVLLRKRAKDRENNKLFFYGPDAITGGGNFVAVEFLDETNDSAVIYFDRDSKLPSHIEYTVTDEMGNRLRQREEFYNWHEHGGVMIPMRRDVLREDKLVEQRHTITVEVNPQIPASQFLEPAVKK